MDLDRIRASIGQARQQRLGRLAVARGWVTDSQLDEALLGGPLEETLVARGWMTEPQLSELLGELDRAPSVGPVAGRYELRERLGEGAVSVVYRAADRELGRDVAIKILKENFLTHDTVRRRFHREAQAMAALDHPNVVRVHDAGEQGNLLFIVLELVEGQPLGRLMDPGPCDLRRALPLLEKAARGVQHAHEKGVIHRDLKPENILVTAGGEAKVADFGLAHLAVESTPALTRTGAVLGTPLYMAPEQVKGDREITQRTDVYALGAILYAMLTGRTPHTGTTLAEVYDKIAREDARPVRKVVPGVSWELEAVCEKALDKDPARRYPSAGALADDLRRFLEGEPVQARPVTPLQRLCRRVAKNRSGLAPVAAALVLAAAASLWAWKGSADRRRHEEAARLLEAGLPPLTRATAALYANQVDDEPVQGPLREAQALIERAIERAPDLPLAHYRLGEVWELRGDFERAEASFREASRLDPGLGPAHYRLGRVLLWRAHLSSIWFWEEQKESRRRTSGQYAREGAREIEAARRLASGFDSEVQREIAAAMIARLGDDPESVRRICGEAIRRFGRREGVEELHWLLGMAQVDPADSLKSLNEAIALRPKFPFALYARANTRKALQDETGAIADYTEAIRISPGFAEAYLDRGSARWGKGDATGAFEDFDGLVQKGALLPGAYNGRGRTLSELMGKPAEAIPDLTEAIRLQPRYGLAWFARARAHLLMGKHAEALADAEQAIARGAAWPDTYFLRGRARAGLGDKNGARQDYERALDTRNPEMLRDVRAAIERLRALN